MDGTETTHANRLLSVDALRGFDMLWIMGGDAIFHQLAKSTGWLPFSWLSVQLDHVQWNGFHAFDLIFPLFLFIAGVSIPFSLQRRKNSGEKQSKTYTHIAFRAFLLVLLGCIYNGLLHFDFENMRYASVLGRIGLAWAFATIICMHTRFRGRLLWIVGILLFYWAFMAFVPVPQFGHGNYTMQGNIASYIDRHILPGVLYLHIHDPEGLVSLVPAIATALLGAMAGSFLRGDIVKTGETTKVASMLAIGSACVALGFLWGTVFPVNKNLWTSSFVLVTAGYSSMLLALFYYIVDVKKYTRWAFVFVVIGLNPITIYMCQAGMVNFYATTEYFFGGIVAAAPGNVQQLIINVLYVAVSWAFLYFLYRKKIFLKI